MTHKYPLALAAIFVTACGGKAGDSQMDSPDAGQSTDARGPSLDAGQLLPADSAPVPTDAGQPDSAPVPGDAGQTAPEIFLDTEPHQDIGRYVLAPNHVVDCQARTESTSEGQTVSISCSGDFYDGAPVPTPNRSFRLNGSNDGLSVLEFHPAGFNGEGCIELSDKFHNVALRCFTDQLQGPVQQEPPSGFFAWIGAGVVVRELRASNQPSDICVIVQDAVMELTGIAMDCRNTLANPGSFPCQDGTTSVLLPPVQFMASSDGRSVSYTASVPELAGSPVQQVTLDESCATHTPTAMLRKAPIVPR